MTNISRGGSNSEDREEKQFIALQVSQIHFFLTKCAVDLARDNKGNDVAATVAKDYNLQNKKKRILKIQHGQQIQKTSFIHFIV